MSMTTDKARNDLNMSAMVLATLLYGALGYRVLGGLTETRFFYQALRVEHYDIAVLPAAWEHVAVSTLRPNDHVDLATIVNSTEI
jgi:hypothetical protein